MIFFILIVVFILLFIGLIIYNNYKLNNVIDEMKITHLNNFITILNTYETLLTVDVKGYFRTDDEVGIIFNNINEIMSNYLEYLSTQIDVLNFDEEFIEINGVDPILLNEKLLSIKNLQGLINEQYKEEQALKLKQKYEKSYKPNPGGKTYINK